MILYVDNTNVVELRALTDSVTGEAVTTATVTVTLYDAGGNDVTGATGVSLAHDSAGTYRGVLPSSVALNRGQSYKAKVAATVGTTVGTWEPRVIAVKREAV